MHSAFMQYGKIHREIKKNDKITLRSDVYGAAILDGKGKRIKGRHLGGSWALNMLLYGGALGAPPRSNVRCAHHSQILFRNSASADVA